MCQFDPKVQFDTKAQGRYRLVTPGHIRSHARSTAPIGFPRKRTCVLCLQQDLFSPSTEQAWMHQCKEACKRSLLSEFKIASLYLPVSQRCISRIFESGLNQYTRKPREIPSRYRTPVHRTLVHPAGRGNQHPNPTGGVFDDFVPLSGTYLLCTVGLSQSFLQN